MKFKILPLILSLVMIFACGCGSDGGDSTPSVPQDKILDVYFIAGQSNAAGCSDFYRKDCVTLNLSPEYAAKADLYKAGFDNVFYYGNAYDTYEGNAYIVDQMIPVKACMGVNNEYEIGAELGMAEYLNDLYSEPDQKALIIKYAVCAAGLIVDGVSFGEWSAPSFKNPNIRNQPDLFVRMIGTEENGYKDGIVYSALTKAVDEGFNVINFKGFYWSQGCAETGAATNLYDDALIALIKDFRAEINNLSIHISWEREAYFDGAEDMPFVISEIAPTQDGAKKRADGTSSNPLVNSIIEQQRSAASRVKRAKTLNTADYDIVNQVEKWSTSTNDGVSYCGDQWHYNADDMLEIGNKVAKMFVEDFE